MINKLIITESQYDILLEYAGYANIWENLIYYIAPIIQHNFKNGKKTTIIKGEILKKINIPDFIGGFIFNTTDKDSIYGSFYPNKIHIDDEMEDNDKLFFCHININKEIIGDTNKLTQTLLHELTHFYETMFINKHGKLKKSYKEKALCHIKEYDDFTEFIRYYLHPSEINAYISEAYYECADSYDSYMNVMRDESSYTYREQMDGMFLDDIFVDTTIYYVIERLTYYKNKVKDDKFIKNLFTICKYNDELRNFFGKLYSKDINSFKIRLYNFLNKKYNYIYKKVQKLFERYMQEKLKKHPAVSDIRKELNRIKKGKK